MTYNRLVSAAVLTLSISLGFLSGCATNPNTSATSSTEVVVPSDEPTQFRVTDLNKAPVEPAVELEIIPTEINASVEKWINYFQGRGRPHMERYLLRSTRYEALMKKVLRDNKLPEDLFYIALIESGFSSSAFSHASAVGYWQFIRGTGKRYKLKINQLVDERRDPVLSTQAAADYFKDLYKLTNSWYLSMASYNVGEGRILRVMRKYKTNDFWELQRHKRALPRETDDYVPKYIAAKLIAKNPDKYGFEGIDYMPPIEFDHVTLNQPVNLRVMAEKMNYNYEEFKALNPRFKGEIAPLDAGEVLGLRIPVGGYEVAMKAAQESVVDKIEYIADRDEIQNYKVRRGDTFATIARKFRTNVAMLRDLNDFPRKKKLRAGQTIMVPDRTPLVEKRPEVMAKTKKSSKPVAVESGSSTAADATRVGASGTGSETFYIVQPGDSLWSIADKYNVSLTSLQKVNNITRKSKLKSGAKLTIPSSKSGGDSKSEQKNSTYKSKKTKGKVALNKKPRSVAKE